MGRLEHGFHAAQGWPHASSMKLLFPAGHTCLPAEYNAAIPGGIEI
jgi:hypothetical protein